MKITTVVKNVAATTVLGAKIVKNVACHTTEKVAVNTCYQTLKLVDRIRPVKREIANTVHITILVVNITL